jgi:CHAT domain-containing protein
MKRKFSPVSLTLGASALAMALAFSGCATPPQNAYEQAGGAVVPSAGLSVGQNAAGEACTVQRQADGSGDVYCGSWDQPSAHVSKGDPANEGDLIGLATTSTWRATLDAAYACEAPQRAAILGGVPAEVLVCTQRQGGWPYVALATVINGNAYYGDGVQPALPAMQRALGVLAGTISPDQAAGADVAQSDQILAQRLAAHAFSSNDIGQYETLMALGSKANQGEDFPAAIIAYRGALAISQNKLGADNPGTVAPLLNLALNLSDNSQFGDAAGDFAQAARLAPKAADPTATATLYHDEALDRLNQGQAQAALGLLAQSRAAFSALVPPALLTAKPQTAQNGALFAVSAPGGVASLLAAQVTLNSPVTQTALLGVIETWRYEALARDQLGDKAGAQAAIDTATRIADANDITPPVLTARLSRTSGALAQAAGKTGAAAGQFADAASNFAADLPGTLPVAESTLLNGAALGANGDKSAALKSCRQGIALLRTLQLGADAALIGPCLDVYETVADANPQQAAGLHGEMFEAAELTQGSVTAREIAQAAARLSNSKANPAVAAAIRAQQDAQAKLQLLYQQRDTAAHAPGGADAAKLAGLDKQIGAASAALQQTSLAEQAAAPNFGQLVQQVVPASAVLKLLHPDEAYLGITTTPTHSWLFFLHDGQVQVAEGAVNDDQMTGLVAAVRASIEPTTQGLPAFDMADAAKIYANTLGPFGGQLASVHELVVAPSGALLSLPFGLLPTGPASAKDLVNAPWLVRQATLSYVPAAANFVALRKAEGTSAAKRPWFGFGDFIPVTLAQSKATFSAPGCQVSAEEFAGLPTLPYAKLELAAGAAIFGATPADELLGPDYTVDNVAKADLKNYQILHFATHGLLPTDLPCQSEPAIVTSAPIGAQNADGALLTSSDVTSLKLDANLVLLSACNTGGGEAGGEALSGLARSFFYAGARALMVTQWSVNDQVSAYLVADTLGRLHAGNGPAAALRAAQLGLLAQAGHKFPVQLADPFFWAAFSVIGDAGLSATGTSG